MSQEREIRSFRGFIFSSLENTVRSLDGLTAEQLNWRPSAPETNSLYALAVHSLGNAEENILTTLCGSDGQRDRAGEFAAVGDSAEPVQEYWTALKARITAALAELPDGALDIERIHPRRGPLTGREILLVVARHAAEHWGQAQLTRDLLQAVVRR